MEERGRPLELPLPRGNHLNGFTALLMCIGVAVNQSWTCTLSLPLNRVRPILGQSKGTL